MGKPYEFIPLLGKQDYKQGKDLFDGRIKLRIKTLTPLYIMRAEIWKEENEKFIRRFYNVNGEYLIPGSSLKGAVRSVAQSVSHSCINTFQKKEAIKGESKSDSKCNCIVCNIFGRMSYKSKVTFRDFRLQDRDGKICVKYIPKLMNPHPEKDFYKENRIFKGIKFYYHGVNEIVEKGVVPVEAVKPNSCFEGEIIFELLDITQLKLLCFSLGLDNTIQLKLGHNKPGYFGSCKVEAVQAEKAKINILDKKYEELNPSALASQWCEEGEEILNNINKLRSILDYRNAKKVSDWKSDDSGRRSY